MKGQAEMTIPEIARVGFTRIALGVGLGLMLANRMTKSERRAVGSTLFICGAVSAGLMAMELFGHPRSLKMRFGQANGGRADFGTQGRWQAHAAFDVP